MKFEELTKENIVFSYQTSPGYGLEGDDGGFSITLYGNGNLKYCTYRLFDQINSLEMFKLSKEQSKSVFRAIKKHEKELIQMPEKLENEKEHSNYYEFIFLDEYKITVWDIQHTNIIWKKLTDHTYYQEHKEHMKYENLILGIFEKISQILKKDDIRLDLLSCDLDRDSKIRVMWK